MRKSRVRRSLLRLLAPVAVAAAAAVALPSGVSGAPGGPQVGEVPPEISCQAWLNTAPLTLKGLRGRVVLLEFWSPG